MCNFLRSSCLFFLLIVHLAENFSPVDNDNIRIPRNESFAMNSISIYLFLQVYCIELDLIVINDPTIEKKTRAFYLSGEIPRWPSRNRIAKDIFHRLGSISQVSSFSPSRSVPTLHTQKSRFQRENSPSHTRTHPLNERHQLLFPRFPPLNNAPSFPTLHIRVYRFDDPTPRYFTTLFPTDSPTFSFPRRPTSLSFFSLSFFHSDFSHSSIPLIIQGEHLIQTVINFQSCQLFPNSAINVF